MDLIVGCRACGGLMPQRDAWEEYSKEDGAFLGYLCARDLEDGGEG